MKKTGQQIEDDIYSFVRNSTLASAINGSVYKYGTRPHASAKEDIVVRFVEADAEQIQAGTIVVNIYVLNIDAFKNGVFMRDIKRSKQLENEANIWVNSLNAARSDYYFKLAQSIYTQEEPDINQHFVTIRLRFKVTTF